MLTIVTARMMGPLETSPSGGGNLTEEALGLGAARVAVVDDMTTLRNGAHGERDRSEMLSSERDTPWPCEIFAQTRGAIGLPKSNPPHAWHPWHLWACPCPCPSYLVLLILQTADHTHHQPASDIPYSPIQLNLGRNVMQAEGRGRGSGEYKAGEAPWTRVCLVRRKRLPCKRRRGLDACAIGQTRKDSSSVRHSVEFPLFLSSHMLPRRMRRILCCGGRTRWRGTASAYRGKHVAH